MFQPECDAGRLRTHSKIAAHPVSCSRCAGEYLAVINKRSVMHLLFMPFLASAIYIGGGVGLVVVILIVVLILR
jgi:hypothetical protein